MDRAERILEGRPPATPTGRKLHQAEVSKLRAWVKKGKAEIAAKERLGATWSEDAMPSDFPMPSAMHQELHTETQMAIEGLDQKVDRIASLLGGKGLEEKVDRLVSFMDESAAGNGTMLALKVQPKWIEKMRKEDSAGRLSSSSGAEELKSEELRLYPPEDHCPKELLPLLKKRIFLVANGEMHGSFKLGTVRHYKTEQQMKVGSGRHKVTLETAPGGLKVTTSYKSFVTKAFHRGAKKGCFGWPLKDLRWFQGKRPACDRPKVLGKFKKVGSPGAKPTVMHDKPKQTRYKGIQVPYFLGQELGQVFCHCAFPAALDVHTEP